MKSISALLVIIFSLWASSSLAEYVKAPYNGRQFDVGCSDIYCGVLVPTTATAKPTRYLRWAADWFEGCYGIDLVCELTDRIVAARLGLPVQAMRAIRQVYRNARDTVIRDVRGNQSDWKYSVPSPSGYYPCNVQWTTVSVRGNSSIVFTPRRNFVAVAGAADARGDRGASIEAALYIRFVKKGEYNRLRRAGTCFALDIGRTKFNSNNPQGKLPRR